MQKKLDIRSTIKLDPTQFINDTLPKMTKALGAQHALDSRGTTTSGRNVQLYWLVLFCISAESFTSCFVPNWKVRSRVWNINLSPTFVNLFGAFLEGAISTMEKQKLSDTVKPISRLFRGGFLGVFTSFSYVVEHASRDSPLYLVGTVIGGCSWYMAGRHAVLYILATRSLSSSSSVEEQPTSLLGFHPSGNIHSDASGEENTRMVVHTLKWVLVMYNLGVLGLAFFGPPGFVREPDHPLTLWSDSDNSVVSDGPELLLGMICSVMGILCSRGIAQLDLVSFFGLGKVWKYPWFRAMDWSTWKCNVCSVYLTLGAYRCMILFPQWKHNFILVKFITSFCSSLSCFSATIGNTMALWYVTPKFAMANMAIHVMSGLCFVPFF